MTPGARVQAAIICLDRIVAGAPAEQVLTTWGRQNRFAGSKDRAAIRDHVYGALRRRRSAAWVGGGDTGRALMIGATILDGEDTAALFSGQGHAPAPLHPGEGGGRLEDAAPAVRADLPDWLWDLLVIDHGVQAEAIAEALRHRAPVFLRVNTLRATRDRAIAALATEGIGTEPHPVVATALRVTGNAAKVQTTMAYSQGLVELQDASSQAAVQRLPLAPGMSVLDYCAGGGGKALAMAAVTDSLVHAHDAGPRRMADIPARAARAGADIRIARNPASAGLFDLVLVDAPCSGSGTWRRTPDAKWRLDAGGLARLTALQSEIVLQAAPLVRLGGWLAYATCSVLDVENTGPVTPLLAGGGWTLADRMTLLPGPDGDGFHLSLLRRD